MDKYIVKHRKNYKCWAKEKMPDNQSKFKCRYHGFKRKSMEQHKK